MPGQQETAFEAPRQGDEGVVIAESRLVPGASHGATASGGSDDCAGAGMGVVVAGSTGDNRFLFDKTGELCEGAQTLFDGRNPQFARAADPSVQLSFQDALGPVPGKAEAGEALPNLQAVPLPRIQEVQVSSRLLPESTLGAVEPAAGPATRVVATRPQTPDPLVATLATWKAQDGVVAARSAESDAAAARTLDALAQKTADKQKEENTAKLAAQLRERERQLEEERRRQAETLIRSQETRALTQAAKQAWEQKQAELETELSATRKRLVEYQQLSQNLAADKAQKEAAYQEKISTLSSDLKTAEAQASDSRRELILKAAAKIAEAEQLAHAAQLQEQDIKLREAARLKAEAQIALDRALAIKAGDAIKGIEPAPVAAPLALMETPVVVHAKDLSLSDLLSLVLKQAEPQSGAWKADWQLSAEHGYILKEKWSLTAEAPVKQVLEQINAQVKSSHGFGLTFTQFSQSRLLVVTDSPAK